MGGESSMYYSVFYHAIHDRIECDTSNVRNKGRKLTIFVLTATVRKRLREEV
jgi:hypothetical protein